LQAWTTVYSSRYFKHLFKVTGVDLVCEIWSHGGRFPHWRKWTPFILPLRLEFL